MPGAVRGGTVDAMSVPVEPVVALPAELRPPLMHDDVVFEADLCLDCRGAHAVAPCTLACAAQVDVPAFIEALARSVSGSPTTSRSSSRGPSSRASGRRFRSSRLSSPAGPQT